MARPLTFHQIEAFHAVVIAGTTVGAAKLLNTTQPSISRLINQAQNSSGLKLFVNDRGRLQLTREGRVLFDTVSKHFIGLGNIEATVSSLREAGAGTLRLAATPSLAQGLLPKAISKFSVQYPNVTFSVATLGSMEIAEGLRLGRYDVALTNTMFDGEEFDVQVVEKSKAVFVSSKRNPISQNSTVTAEMVAGQKYISLPAHDEVSIRLRGIMESKKLKLHNFIETTYTSTLCAMVELDLGVSVINPYMADYFSDRVAVRKFTPGIPLSIYMIFSKFSPYSELADKFLTSVKSLVGDRD